MNENKKQKTITIKLRTIIIAIVVLTSALLISIALTTGAFLDKSAIVRRYSFCAPLTPSSLIQASISVSVLVA